ncbi:hypothetical protein FHT78_005468 [Rhizobium sp. BK196]|uniref:hypothetical protein n=1 Tax=Rhizobium sp. BK196 TaxID=2587073 RepID=UPI00161DC3E9|nr:hypothetical protein [Rhizobium sp. BK196]MBB3313674.1 hypothetical protein [Rhizobium sp. BK196]
MIDARTLRNVIAVMRNIDRDQIETEVGRITDVFWNEFQANPYRSFLRMNDHGQAGIARVVSARMPE